VKKLTWFLLFSLFAASCLDQPDCFLLNNDLVGVSFRVIGSSNADSVTLSSVDIEGYATIAPTGEDTLISTIVLPLNYFTESSTFVFNQQDRAGSMNVFYTVQSQFVSEDCGPRYVLSDISYSQTGFDSTRVVNPTPGRDASTRNIEVFRCPRLDVLGIAFQQLTLTATDATTRGSRAVSARVNAIKADDKIVYEYAGANIARAFIPVDTTKDNTKFTFTFGDQFGYGSPERAFTVNYTTTTDLFYKQCGVQTRVTDLEVINDNAVPFDLVSFVKDNRGDSLTTLVDPHRVNLNVYRCPPTNIAQAAFRRNGSSLSLDLVNITASHLPAPIYVDTTLAVVQLPLNENAATSTFTVNYGNGASVTVSLAHTWTAIAPTRVANGACRSLFVVNNLSAPNQANITITEPEVLYPAVTNFNIEIPQ
jgi:hypothetical protein